MRSRLAGIVVLLLAAQLAGAQEAADHPTVGRYGGSEIVHQELSRYSEYELTADEETTQTLRGEVWMTLYDAPEDASTFGVYSTYLDYLRGEGFEIIAGYPPGECPSGLLEDVYFRAQFADNGNYGHPAPFTNGNDGLAAYIAAQRDETLYVGIAIATGWESYPQYKVDVVEVGGNAQRVTWIDAAAGEPADNRAVGRFNRSEMVHQEIGRFAEYEIAVGEDDTTTVEGELWMTLYDAPRDSSTYGVYATYLDYLEGEGFEIMVNCKPGECPSGLLEDVYFRGEFADNGNYGHPAPFTNGNDSMSAYIAAQRDEAIYVSIAIAAGWTAYPQYKVDVLERAGNSAGITSTGTREEPPAGADAELDEPPEPTSDDAAPSETVRRTPSSARAAGGFLTENGGLVVRTGIAGYLLLDPAIAGDFFITEDGGTLTAHPDGFKNWYGPFARLTWFANETVGLGVDVTYMQCDEEFTVENTTYRSQGNIGFVQASLSVRMVGREYPASVTVSFAGGVAIVWLAQSTTGATETYYSVEDTLPAFGTTIDLSIPILQSVHLATGMAYQFVPASDLSLANEDWSYSRTYSEANLGGLELRLGMVFEL